MDNNYFKCNQECGGKMKAEKEENEKRGENLRWC